MGLTTSDSPQLDLYRQLRMAGRRVISKLHEVSRAPDINLLNAARKLTIHVSGRTFVFDDAGQMSILMDFHFHEMRYRGRRIIDMLAESNTDLTPDERAMLDAKRAARCSLFGIVGVDPETCQIRLQDLLEPKAPAVALTDISLSRSPVVTGDLLYTRIVSCQGIHMSGGFIFPFRAVHRVHLLNAYAERMRTVPEKERALRAYVFFFRKCRDIGMDQAYEENF